MSGKTLIQKTCALNDCDEKFYTPNDQRKYCSNECAKEADRRKARNRYWRKKGLPLPEGFGVTKITDLEVPPPTPSSPVRFIRDILKRLFSEQNNRLIAVESTLAELVQYFPISEHMPDEPRLKRTILLVAACRNDLAMFQLSSILQRILKIPQREAERLLIAAKNYLRNKDPSQTTIGEFM